MEDRDGKKSFIIPKTYTTTKDVLISEKTDSRNVLELFNDMKSCALDVHFDFRQNECQSCDTIRNSKLQKSFNERRVQMKKSYDLVERFAFHLITSRDIALKIATDGLTCEQLTFPIEKYLGNPKDGIHLSRRPDVLLTSTGTQDLSKFGILICKILVGKGYATIPSVNNKELPAQLHYDHHFCKIQTLNQEQRLSENVLANSLIFCYEHDDLQTVSRPSQILPLAVLWYDLKGKFSSEVKPTSQESQQHIVKSAKPKKPIQNRLPIKPIPKPVLTSENGTWDNLSQNTTPVSVPSTPSLSQFMIPYSSLYTSFSTPQPPATQRDPRLTRKLSSSETIPLSPQNTLIEKPISSKQIPFNSTSQLLDPRLETLKSTRNIFYLESNAIKHAIQQQKRLNHYYTSKNISVPRKTSYTLIPFFIRSISLEEYERQNQISKSSSSYSHYASLHVSVIDCFHFGLKKSEKQSYVDLEQHENQVAYEQINISNQLIQHEKQLNAQEIRLHLREKRQRKIHEQINERNNYDSSDSKTYINKGRKFLKERSLTTTSSNDQISVELLDFFSSEYRDETRPYVKRILAELLGVFLEKYSPEHKQAMLNGTVNSSIDVSNIDYQTIGSVIDMDLESPSSQTLGDHDERFPVPILPIIESVHNEILSNQQNQTHDNASNNPVPLVQPVQTELPPCESNLPTVDISIQQNIEQTSFSSTEVMNMDDNQSSTINDDSKQSTVADVSIKIGNDLNRSRDEFVKLLTKEAQILESSNPPELLKHRRESYDSDESNTNKKLASTRTVTLVSHSYEDNLIIEASTTNIEEQEAEEEEEEEEASRTVKRIKVDLISSSNEDINTSNTITDDHDYRNDLDDRRRQAGNYNKSSRSRSTSTSSRQSSLRGSKTRSPSSSSSRASSINNRYSSQRRQKYIDERHRSYDYPARNRNDSIASHSQLPRHQRFNYNHQSVAEHPRFANVDSTPSLMEGYTRNLFDTSNYSQPMPNTNRNYNSSYHNGASSNHQYYEDNYNNTPPQPPPLMSTTPAMNFPNSCDSKPSNTIERLQMLLQNRTATPYDHKQSSITGYSSSSYAMNSHENGNDHQWSSIRYNSRIPSNTNIPNNQSFTYNDAEQLLTYVQHLRN